MDASPVTALLASPGPIVLDGGLATELERRGHDLSDDLWSARLLRDDPGAIEYVHLTYFRAGAQVAITSSYQASFEGFAAAGIERDEAARLLRLSVELADRARRRRIAELEDAGDGVPLLLVAASVGPYGAVLADGQEYTGGYGLTRAELRDFHRPRLRELVAARPDVIAFETIPSLLEAEALVELLSEFPGVLAWLSFSCADGTRTCEGQPIEDAVAVAGRSAQVIATGVNCTAPAVVESLLDRARNAVDRPLVAYPNDGRLWDGPSRRWLGAGSGGFPAAAVERWHELGARLIGGCCGIGPDGIRSLAGIAAGWG
jgi:homocysteine S-methyltransferase